MELVTAKLQSSNPRDPSLAPLEVTALADTGSVFLRDLQARGLSAGDEKPDCAGWPP
jgi:hypothetical protein